jgi:hypothetical protein
MAKRAPKQGAAIARGTATTLIVHVPLAIRKRGSRKLIITPGNAPVMARPENRIDNAVVKALARAHRWKRMLESGQFASVAELAAAEKTNESYVCRILRLTLLAPQIVERVLNGARDAPLLAQISRPFPVRWGEQLQQIGSLATRVGSVTPN